MGKVARHQVFAHLLEALETRTLLSTTAGAPGVAGSLPDPLLTPARHYRAVPISHDADAGDSAQAYFDIRKRMMSATPVLTVHAAVGGWNTALTSANLSAYATYTGTGGDAALTYTWTPVTVPVGAVPIFSNNFTYGARNTSVTFDRAGNYQFSVTISDGHYEVTDSVAFAITTVATHLDIAAAPLQVTVGNSQQESATLFDQFNRAMNVTPGWSVTGQGSISSSGLLQAGTTPGTASVQASAGGLTSSINVTISASPPPPVVVTAANGSVAGSGTQATLSVLGDDDGGEANLTYSWSIVSQPSGAAALFSINGNNASKNTAVTFNKAGSYSFMVSISDGFSAVTSSVNLSVAQVVASINVTAGSASVNLNQTTTFSASAFDQFGSAFTSAPAFTWSKFSGVGAVNSSGVFSSSVAGSATIRATAGGINGSANVTVVNAAPTVATGASAGSGSVTGTTATLSVLGADDGGESGLTYSWSATTLPSGATASFSSNGNNVSKSTVVTFSKAGAYTFLVTISDGALTVSSSVSLTVLQTLTSINVSPSSASLNLNATQAFSAIGNDQFGVALASQPTFTWTKFSGVGSINSSGGVFSSAAAGAATIRATSGNVFGAASVTVTSAAPTVATPAAASASTVTGTTVTLSVLGADGGGEGGLTYSWSATTQPSGALTSYSSNGADASKSTVATFTRAGAYTFQVTISDGSLTVSSSVSLTVSATLTTVTVSGAASVQAGNTAQFTMAALDQFAQVIASPGSVSWTVDAGGVGSINSSGLYSAGGSTGSAMVRATVGGIGGTSALTVTLGVTPLTITTPTLTGFTDLVVHGTSGFDTITVTKSGTVYTFTHNGASQTASGTFQDLVIYAGSAGSLITVDSSVTINVRLYGGAGSDDMRISGTGGYNAIVSIGGGVDSLTGNGTSTYFWADTADTVHSTAADVTANRVHQITSFYQPWSTDPNNANYVSTSLSGQNLADPNDSGTTHTGTGWSLFGTAPQTTDIRQGGIGDCFLMATLGSLAYSGPARIYRSAVDLGDGTYAVRFSHFGVEYVVRVDADLASFQAGVSPTGGIWVPIFEKAYAFYRTGSNTYASLNSGWMSNVLTDLECTASNMLTSSTDSTLSASIQNGLTTGLAMSVGTGTSISAGAPLITSHAYMVVGVFYDSVAATWDVQLRNPWGFDGAGNDGNPSDGIVTLTFAQIRANFSVIVAGA